MLRNAHKNIWKNSIGKRIRIKQQRDSETDHMMIWGSGTLNTMDLCGKTCPPLI